MMASAVVCRDASCELTQQHPPPFCVLQLCRTCFYQCLEDEVHHTIVTHKLFKRGERVAIAASGGKDSTVLAHMMTLLNERHE